MYVKNAQPKSTYDSREKNYKTTKTIRLKCIRTNYRKRRIFDGISIVDEFDRFVQTKTNGPRQKNITCKTV